jgi:hypothetical protein
VDDERRPSTQRIALQDIVEIIAEACVVLFWLLVIAGVEYASHALVPPHGPVFYVGSAFEFPLQWMIDTAHIINFGGFVIRNLIRSWLHWWR